MACLNGANVTITPTASRVSASTNSSRRIIIKQKTQAIAKHYLTSSFAFTKLPRNWRVFKTEGKKEGGLAVLVRAAAETGSMATEKSGIKIINSPPESKLAELGVRSWPKWGCPPSKFPWTYSSKETCFLLKGKVKVYPEGSNNAVEIGAGDLVEFPKGMNCTWDVSEAVDKHYNFE